jgi:hypothetical protein
MTADLDFISNKNLFMTAITHFFLTLVIKLVDDALLGLIARDVEQGFFLNKLVKHSVSCSSKLL